MTQTTALSREQAFKLGQGSSPLTCEQLLRQIPETASQPCTLRLSSQTGSQFFADIWAAIVAGTFCRRQYPISKIVTWGLKDWNLNAAFASSLAGLTAIQLSDRVRTETTDNPVDIDDIEHRISKERGGVLETVSGKIRTLVEFDPQTSIAPKLRAETAYERALLFKNLILTFRRDLELGHKLHQQPVRDQGELRTLTAFLGELHGNAFRYSRTTSYQGRSRRGIRFVRLRAHLATRDAELRARAYDNPVLLSYLNGKSLAGLMEASVSDFGQGIVDHFLSSQRGQRYKNQDRRHVLHLLIHDTLSSSSDPAAGYGLPKVLRAAGMMGAFISLRTAEFWLAHTSDPQRSPELSDVPGEKARVAGTHWQFLWPMGI